MSSLHQRPLNRNRESYLRLVIGKKKKKYAIGERILPDAERRKLQDRFARSPRSMTCNLKQLLETDEASRVACISLLAGIPEVSFCYGDGSHKDFFVAALRLLKRIGGSAARRLVIDVACLTSPEDLAAAMERIAKIIDAGPKPGLAEIDLAAALNKRAAELGLKVPPLQVQHPVRHNFPEAPVPSTTVIPAGWAVTSTGVSSLKGKASILKPVLLGQLFAEAATGEQRLLLLWKEAEVWRQRVVGRAELATTQKIIELSKFGVPVNSANATEVIAYLAAFEAANAALPRQQWSSRLGWHNLGDGEAFLLQDALVTKNGRQAFGYDSALRHISPDQGSENIVAGVRRQGELKEWIRTIGFIEEFPVAQLLLYASFAAPALKVFGAPNILVDVAGDTSIGKTACLSFSASPWGLNAMKNSGVPTFVHPCDFTPTWYERAAALLSDLPICLDDTRRLQDPEVLVRIAYAQEHGAGKGRGSVSGLAGNS